MSQGREITITVDPRDTVGSRGAASLRRDGLVPAVVYGGDQPPYPITVEAKTVLDLLRSEHGTHSIFTLKLKGKKDTRDVMIRELQTDPMSGQLLHIDFIRLVKGQLIDIDMPIQLVGDSVGVRHGGRLDWVTRQVRLEVLPREMFDRLTLDISEMEIGDVKTLADMEDQLPESAKYLEDSGRVVVVIDAPRMIEEEEEEAEDEALVAEESAEPEVIKKGKEEDEDEDE